MEKNTFRLDDFDCIGFDMDHTFVQYNLPEVFKLIYSAVVEHLVKEKGYSEDLLHFDNYDKFEDFSLRGLVVDLMKGNFIKIDKDGHVMCASHGMCPMTDEEIEKDYGSDRKWKSIDVLKEKVFHSDGFLIMDNFFWMPAMSVIAQLIEDADKKNNGRLTDYNHLSTDLMEAFRTNFRVTSFKDGSGKFFPSLKKDTKKYVKKCSQKLIDWIKSLHTSGKKTILLTDSYGNFANHMMTYAVGENWKELFDFIVVHANKPTFFKEENKDHPFYVVNTEDFESTEEEASELKTETLYSRGSAFKLQQTICKSVNKENSKIIYFGDSLKCDVFPPNKYIGWKTVAVLEELEAEGTDIYNNNEEPAKKRPKLCPLLKEEKLLIASKQWGSFFYHNFKDEKRETFWLDLVRKHSCMTIPALDYLTDNDLSHDYERFSNSNDGFYPFTPQVHTNLHVNKKTENS